MTIPLKIKYCIVPNKEPSMMDRIEAMRKNISVEMAIEEKIARQMGIDTIETSCFFYLFERGRLRIVRGKGELGEINRALVNKEPTDEERAVASRKRRFLEVYEQTLGSIGPSCEKTGIAERTWQYWRKEDPEFRAGIERLDRKKYKDVETLANKKMLEGDSAMIRFWLERRHPEFKPKLKIETPLAGEKSAEDMLECIELIDDYGKNYFEQITIHSGQLPNQEQEGNSCAVQFEPGAKNVLAVKNEA